MEGKQQEQRKLELMKWVKGGWGKLWRNGGKVGETRRKILEIFTHRQIGKENLI